MKAKPQVGTLHIRGARHYILVRLAKPVKDEFGQPVRFDTRAEAEAALAKELNVSLPNPDQSQSPRSES